MSRFCVIADSGPTVLSRRVWFDHHEEAAHHGRAIQIKMAREGIAPRELFVVCKVDVLHGVPQSSLEPKDRPSEWQCHAYRLQWRDRNTGQKGT